MKGKSILLAFLLLCYHTAVQAQCTVTAMIVNDAICGQCNGAINLSFTGGTPPYAVSFNGIPMGSYSQSLFVPNLCPGNYYYSVTDFTGLQCTGSLNISIGNSGSPTPVSITFSTTNPSCTSCSDGSITAMVTGGIPPYTYYWSNGANTSSINGLGAGIYYLYVYDQSGCSDTDAVSLNYGGLPLSLMTGRAYYDINGDSVYNAPDFPLSGQQIQKQPSGQITYTDVNGIYTFGDTAGSYLISYVPTGKYHTVQVNNTYTVSLSGGNQTGLDFALQPDSLFHSIYVNSYIPLPRCNTLRPYYTYITNNGTAVDSGTVTFYFDSLLTPTSYSSGGVVNGQSITFPFDSLLPNETRQFVTNFNLPGPNSVLDHSTNGVLYDNSGLVLASDSTYGSVMVLCSFDPNDKQVDPIGEGTNHIVPMNTELRYLIRFQNTGNDTAFNIMVTDTLNAGIDVSTVYIIATSHPAYFLKDGGNILKVYFDNINLPDSATDEDGSHGYILFRCFGNTTNPDPTIITNSAAIFFDMNPPILTNSVFNTLTNATSATPEINAYSDKGIRLVPNPAEKYAMVILEEFTGGEALLEVYSVNGNKVEAGIVRNNQLVLDTKNWNSGLYLIRVTDVNGNWSKVARLCVKN